MGSAPGTPASESSGVEPESGETDSAPEARPGAPRILLISGSTRPGSTNTAALRTFADIAAPALMAELFTGLVEIPAFVPGDQPAPPAVRALREQLAAADAVVFCAPEYAGLIPGSLKNLLEWTVGTADLHEKPVAWISVAAPGRGEGAITSLRAVLGYVGAVEIESACRRITLLGTMVGPDEKAADAPVREALAESAAAIGAYLSAAASREL
ncbi:NADPH-dependent FMN reductase [Nocardia nova]|uniref:NADPH-dependent FMN reductase n=1 Tax=Nocardia nova TaxID=37330 RepID=A0A2S6AGD1_9NOCA|nr:NADPH-dependent FMN reductase [Nocardia nova]PPJ22774.1 NADPH-dependent FMN reductase [Nocardia nova]PPJ33427.1 NADPH-dependent FMN reductase [Nocardia nova]